MQYRRKLFRDRWYVVWFDDGTKRQSLHTADADEAERRLQDFIKQRTGQLNTAGQIWHAYIADKVPTVKHKNFAYAWKFLSPHFNSLRPDQITRENTRRYTAWRIKAGVQESTVLRELGRLKAALRWHDKGTKAVFAMPSAGQPRDKYITKAEYRRLLDCALAPHMRVFIAIAGQTGARMTAILELTWRQVDFERGLINFAIGDQKGRKNRATVKMASTLRSEMEFAHQVRTCDYVVEYGGRRVLSVKKGFEAAARRAGLDITAHVLRHSAAVWMAEAGHPMGAIAQVLGHKDSRVTEKHYAKYSPDYMADVMESLAI